jgi:pimeloyl-ACP methyl ester carboxylesterase
MGMDAHSMDLLAEGLNDSFSVLSLTILGHGDSSVPESHLSLSEHASIMRECYKQLDFLPNVLIGHSVGGMMGMVLAAEHPDEHLGLVLVDIAPFKSSGSTRPSPPEYFATETTAREWLRIRYPGFTDYYLYNRLRYAFIKKEGLFYMKPRGDSIRVGLTIDLWPYVERINTPTLLLVGEESDLVTPVTIRKMESVMRDLKVKVVKGTGHMIPQEKPGEFQDLIMDFLEGINL